MCYQPCYEMRRGKYQCAGAFKRIIYAKIVVFYKRENNIQISDLRTDSTEKFQIFAPSKMSKYIDDR